MKKSCSLFCLCMLAVQISAQEPTSYSIENDITYAYLNEFSYDTIADYNVSYVRDYIARPHDYRLDAPKPIRLSWTHEDGAEAQSIEIWEMIEAKDTIIFTIDKDTAEYDLYNMIPGKTYCYVIKSTKNDVTTVKASGQIAPTGMLRWIYAEGTWNVRDMGGWKGLGGHSIAYGKIFRGAQLTRPTSPYDVLLTESGIEAIRNAGIRAELDLRSSSQAHYSYASFAKKDANNKYDADFKNIATTSARMWKYDNDDSNIKAVQWVINELKAGKPVFYHCQNGADRTGTIGFLIGALLGMSEGDLAKDYELTTFCQDAAVKFDPDEKDFARLRNYEGKYGSIDNSSDKEDYMFAPLIDKLKGVSGPSIQRKIYDFFKNGKNGTKISEADLDWFIREMVDYAMVRNVSTDVDTDLSKNGYISMQLGQSLNLNPQLVPADATVQTMSFKSDNKNIAVVSDDGVITAVGQGNTKIRIQAGDGVTKVVQVIIPVVESVAPDSVEINGTYYKTTGVNKITDGSFEYRYFKDWKNAASTNMSKDYFDIKKYSENADSVYIESKTDGDGTSDGSIRAQWYVNKKKTFVFGYRVKSSKDTTIVSNENLKVMLTTTDAPDDDASTIILKAPSYDGNWTEIQYVFTASSTCLRILFTHLSENGANTCFDNFYLSELVVPSGFDAVKPISAAPDGVGEYYLNSHIRIVDGKKYLVR